MPTSWSNVGDPSATPWLDYAGLGFPYDIPSEFGDEGTLTWAAITDPSNTTWSAVSEP